MNYIEIEQAIIALLQGMDVKQIKPYSGELYPDILEQEICRFPAIFVFVSEMKNSVRNKMDERTYKIVINAVSLDLRKKEANGAYQLIEGVRKRLHRKTINSLGELNLLSEKVIGISGKGVAIMEAIYEIRSLVNG